MAGPPGRGWPACPSVVSLATARPALRWSGRRPSRGAIRMDWDALRRREFPVADHWAYLDHAAVAPLPRRSGDALREWVDDQERNGVIHWPLWGRKVEQARSG